MATVVDQVINGAIDVHTHIGPDPHRERRMDALEVCQYAQNLGLGGLVLKSHQYPTEPVAAMVRHTVKDIQIWGAVALDEEVGGVNASAVECSARMGGRVVWMPTESADHHYRKQKNDKKGLSLLGPDGSLTKETLQVLEVVREHRLSLASGHISGPELRALLAETKRMGIGPVIITHPLLMTFVPDLSIEELRSLADQGNLVEFCFVACMPGSSRQVPPAEMAATMRALGIQHVVLGTDGGLNWLPPAPELLRVGIASLNKVGMSAGELETITKANPSRWLKIA